MARDKEKQKEKQHESYLRHKAKYVTRQNDRRKERAAWLQQVFDTQKCFFCEESANECLDFHHIDPELKDDGISTLLHKLKAMTRVKEEMEKCVILCSNCHRKFHKGTIDYVFKCEDAFKIPDHLRDFKN